MHGTGNDGYLIRERNAELLREVGVARLQRRLRANKRSRTGVRGGLRLTIWRIRLAISGDASAEQTTS